jgi:hypothetical protein
MCKSSEHRYKGMGDMKSMKTLILVGLLASALAVIGCSDDPAPPAATGGTGGNGTGGTGGNGTGGNGGDAGNGGNGGECMDGDLCCIELCTTNENFRTVCLDEYNDCVGMDGDPGQCKVAAEETCTI